MASKVCGVHNSVTTPSYLVERVHNHNYSVNRESLDIWMVYSIEPKVCNPQVMDASAPCVLANCSLISYLAVDRHQQLEARRPRGNVRRACLMCHVSTFITAIDCQGLFFHLSTIVTAGRPRVTAFGITKMLGIGGLGWK